MTTYSRANAQLQWFADNFRGSRIKPNVLVLHTTEGGSWPSYGGGASAPHLTAMPDRASRRLLFRQHFPFEVSARALVNASGGVETNTLNSVQIELVGTCDPALHRRLPSLMFWPDAPDWALQGLAHFVRELHDKFPAFPIRDCAPRGWLPYPPSFGTARGQRMSFDEWRRAVGICGHQHVPENVHGDPGAFPIKRLLAFALPEQPKPELTEIEKIRARLRQLRERAENRGNIDRAKRIQRGLNELPRK